MSLKSFSNRHGYKNLSGIEITVRQDAPHHFRGVLIGFAYESGFCPDSLRTVICRTLRKRENRDNWTEYPNIDDENHDLIDDCQWYNVYDIAESIYKKMEGNHRSYMPEKFETDLNEYFLESGIGWRLKEGLIESRGSDGYENIIKVADNALTKSARNTAKNELHEAYADLSRRPKSDITGAIQHSMAALECVAREACGDNKATLGEIINRHKGLIPPPLDQAITKAWGYASENARHIQEGREPSYDEAELIVGICASVSGYLSGKEKVIKQIP